MDDPTPDSNWVEGIDFSPLDSELEQFHKFMVMHEDKVKEVVGEYIGQGLNSFVVTITGYTVWSSEHSHMHYAIDYPFTNCSPEQVKDMLTKLANELET